MKQIWMRAFCVSVVQDEALIPRGLKHTAHDYDTTLDILHDQNEPKDHKIERDTKENDEKLIRSD